MRRFEPQLNQQQCQAQARLGRAAINQPLEQGAQIGMFLFQPRYPRRSRRSKGVFENLPGQSGVKHNQALVDQIAFAMFGELRACELSPRIGEPVSRPRFQFVPQDHAPFDRAGQQ